MVEQILALRRRSKGKGGLSNATLSVPKRGNLLKCFRRCSLCVTAIASCDRYHDRYQNGNRRTIQHEVDITFPLTE